MTGRRTPDGAGARAQGLDSSPRACSIRGMRAQVCWAALATAVLLAAPAIAGEPIVLDYDIRYGPLRLVEMRTTADVDESRYTAVADVRTVGMAAMLFPWQSQARSAGRRAKSGLQPREHRSEGQYRGERRRVEIRYAEAGPVETSIEPPPEDDFREAVPAEMLAGTIDPLTATLAVLDSDCRGRLRIFDGRRRYDLALEDLGHGDVEPSSYRLYAGPARRCRARVEALGGFWQEDPRHSEKPTTLDYWVAQPNPHLPPVPVYVELAGARGTLRIHLTAIGQDPDRIGRR